MKAGRGGPATRASRVLMDRKEILMGMFDPSGVGLEIGPGFNPLISKSSGLRIETVDHATAAELREKWKNDPRVDVSRIEEVDHVSNGGSLVEAVGKTRYFDYVVASHVVEHTTDLVGFLRDCSALLKEGGVLVLAVPDKRRCFDVFQGLTTTGAVLQAHLEGRTRHSPGAVFDYHAYYALRNGEIGWAGGSSSELTFQYGLAEAKAAYELALVSDLYQDVHAWRFTPSSFRLILHDLHAMGLVDLKEANFVEGPGVEFYISLSTGGSGCPLDRLTLAKLTLAEQYEVLVDSAEADARPPQDDTLLDRVRRLEAVSLHLATKTTA
jgi:SAM-dependent methyltransferase